MAFDHYPIHQSLGHGVTMAIANNRTVVRSDGRCRGRMKAGGFRPPCHADAGARAPVQFRPVSAALVDERGRQVQSGPGPAAAERGTGPFLFLLVAETEPDPAHLPQLPLQWILSFPNLPYLTFYSGQDPSGPFLPACPAAHCLLPTRPNQSRPFRTWLGLSLGGGQAPSHLA
jgi:hypothetical protein